MADTTVASRLCLVCEAQLPEGKRKFCSQDCKLAARRASSRSVHECIECGASLAGRRGALRFCSDECSRVATRRKGRERWRQKAASQARQRPCDGCGCVLVYGAGTRRGEFPRWCSDGCRALAHRESRFMHHREYLAGRRRCSIEGCSRPPRPGSQTICEVHYCRDRRTGSYSDPPVPVVNRRYEASTGYVMLTNSSHPLAVGSSVFEHRAVLYDSLQGKNAPCHWCGCPLVWRTKARGAGLVVDHLDHDRANNELSNLVASCHACNASRRADADMRQWVESVAVRALVLRHAEERRAIIARLCAEVGVDGDATGLVCVTIRMPVT